MLAIGAFIGLLIAIAFDAFVESGLSLLSTKEVFSAVMGASIALAGTYFTLADLAKSRQAEAKDRDDALAISAFVKSQEFYNRLKNLQSTICTQYSGLNAYDKERFGLFLAPPANSHQPIFFTTDERAVFLRQRKINLFNFVTDLDHIHNATVNAVNRFTELKINFMLTVPATEGSTGMVTELTNENPATIEPKFALLNNIAKQLPARIDEDTEYADQAVLALFADLKERGILPQNFKFNGREP